MKTKKTQLRVLKEDPVAKTLTEGKFRHQVIPSKKRYKRQDNKKQARVWIQSAKEPGPLNNLPIAC